MRREDLGKREYYFILHLPRSSDYLRDHPELVCADTSNYLTMWCVNLEVQGVCV